MSKTKPALTPNEAGRNRCQTLRGADPDPLAPPTGNKLGPM